MPLGNSVRPKYSYKIFLVKKQQTTPELSSTDDEVACSVFEDKERQEEKVEGGLLNNVSVSH